MQPNNQRLLFLILLDFFMLFLNFLVHFGYTEHNVFFIMVCIDILYLAHMT